MGLSTDLSTVEFLSFDVFGTLISVRDSSYGAFERILQEASGAGVDVRAFWEYWEETNIEAYWDPYRPYRDICKASLASAFEAFDLKGDPESIQHYFDSFADFELYDDVIPTLNELKKDYRLAVVSNIDDDLLAATPLMRKSGGLFSLVCTAEKAQGYKPDGTLFRYLLEHAGVGVDGIFHSGQSQFTDMVGAKPLGIAMAWINRRGISLSPKVPKPDYTFPDIKSLLTLLA